MKFEDAGRAIDRELDKLRKFFDDEVRPETKGDGGVPEKVRGAPDENGGAIGKGRGKTLTPC